MHAGHPDHPIQLANRMPSATSKTAVPAPPKTKNAAQPSTAHATLSSSVISHHPVSWPRRAFAVLSRRSCLPPSPFVRKLLVDRHAPTGRALRAMNPRVPQPRQRGVHAIERDWAILFPPMTGAPASIPPSAQPVAHGFPPRTRIAAALALIRLAASILPSCLASSRSDIPSFTRAR